MSSVISKIREQDARERVKGYFENIADDDFEITSPFDAKYNCIAHAVDDNKKWWWAVDTMSAGNDVFWFDDVPNQTTLGNFIRAFEKLGYVPCENSEFEKEFEKVVIYVSTKSEFYAPEGTPTHMARQLTDGNWTSKLG